MGLGCILCRKPLVNYVTLKRINWAKANGVNGRAKQECPSCHDDPSQHKNNQVLVSTCGHLFHKQCLKSFFTNGNTKKSYSSTHKLCPYCNTCFQLEKCFPIYLKPESDSTGCEMKRLIIDNNKLQQNLITLKKLLKKREAQLKSIVDEIEQIETGGGDGTSSQEGQNPDEDRVLESEEEEEMLKHVSAYSNLNQRLVSMIQESMKMEDAIWNPNSTDGSQLGAYNYSPLYKRPGTPKFQSGQFFNADALRTQYASYNNMNNMNGNSKLEPEGPYQNYNSGLSMGNSGPFPNPNVELNYFHQLESMPGTGEYQIVQNPAHHRNMASFEPKHKQAQATALYDNNNGPNRLCEAKYPYLGARPDPYKPLLSIQKQIQNRCINVLPYDDSTTNHSSLAVPPKSRVPLIKDSQRPAFLKEMPSVHNYNYY